MDLTVIDVLKETTQKHQHKVAIKYKKNNLWISVTWQEYQEKVFSFAKGLIENGLNSNDNVVILSQNCFEWVVANLASIAAGGVPAGIYPTSSSEQCAYIINHCKATIAIVENQEQLNKIKELKPVLPSLKFVVLIRGEDADSNVYSWKEIEQQGHLLSSDNLDERLKLQKPDALATMVYTSGTTAQPKAVMLSHQNLTWTATTICVDSLNITDKDIILSYLPLSHIAEQMISVHAPLRSGACVWFAESIDKLASNLKEVRPTLFFGVPRVWEKIQQSMMTQSSKQNFIKKLLFNCARKVGLSYHKNTERSIWISTGYSIFQKIIFNKVRKALGLDRCSLQITSAAPISMDTLNFFFSLDIPLYEIYGMSECSGPATISFPKQYRIGKTGCPLAKTQIKIADDNEILMKGPHVFLGYLNNDQATLETIDQDGWLHSGDLGELDEEGFLAITGRKKNLLITAGGENVAPEMLENKLKAIPGIEQTVVIGDQRKYLSALFTLSEEALEIGKRTGSSATNIEELSKCNIFHQFLNQQIEHINQSVARVQSIKKFSILSGSFSEATGELTPTMKIKRNYIYKKYSSEIASLY